MRLLFCLVLFSILFNIINAACPNKCSGHGSCGIDDVCSCQQNWINGDCSGRRCPYTRAWVDTPEANNDGHYYKECGNRGHCDRKTGLCKCDAPFGGSGCRRLLCTKDCNRQGTCEFIEELAKDDEDIRVGGASNRIYTQWDQEKIMGCKCDPGLEGHDCSLKVCPAGDDQLTTGQNDMVQYIYLDSTATKQFYLKYKGPYGHRFTTERIVVGGSDAVTCSNIQNALRSLPNHALDDITVSATSDNTIIPYTRTAGSDVNSVGAGTTATAVTYATQYGCLINFPRAVGTTGLQHIISCHFSASDAHEGSQPLISNPVGSCVTGEHVPTGTTSRPLTELATCSNRGICDGSTGLCKCFTGHKGLACESQEALV